MSRIIFKEDQHFRNTWLMYLLLGVSVLTIALFTYAMIQQLGFGEQWGDEPLSDAGLIILSSTMILFLLLINAILLWAKLEIQIKENSLYYRFIPFSPAWKYIYKDEIKHFLIYETRGVFKIFRHGGYGYHYNFFTKSVSMIMPGNKIIRIETIKGRKVFIGTNKLDEFAHSLKELGLMKEKEE